MKMLQKLGSSLLALSVFAGIASAQKWQNLKHEPSFPVGAIALLTDGTVLLHVEQNGPPQDWYKLTPDNTGSYINGTIKPIASMPVINGTQYGPWFFGSVVLPDGRYVVEGGEYNDTTPDWTNLGAIYDPVKNKWTPVNPPAGWASIGDAQAILLADGTYTQADCCEGVNQAYFNPKTLKWTKLTNTHKADRFDEEGWNLLPNGDILTVDALDAPNSEVFNPATKKWSSAGSTIVRLEDPSTQEIGPAVLMPNGTVYATGANTAGAGHTAIFNTKTKKWSKGPDFPNNLDAADAPAALEINGNVIVMTSVGYGNNFPSVFFEWNGKTLTKLPPALNAANDASFYGHFLELPTGQLLFSDLSSELEVFTPKGTYNKAWAPKITSAPGSVNVGSTYVIKGTQFSGLSGGASYGDDFQDATNYALVRITNNATKHVFYAKTTKPSTYAVQTGALAESTHFTVAENTELGESTLVVVTNGIPSTPVRLTVQK
jgi:hypothetical protein